MYFNFFQFWSFVSASARCSLLTWTPNLEEGNLINLRSRAGYRSQLRATSSRPDTYRTIKSGARKGNTWNGRWRVTCLSDQLTDEWGCDRTPAYISLCTNSLDIKIPIKFVFWVLQPGADPGISKRGGCCPGAVEFLVLIKVCIDAPSHIPYVFVRRVVNNNKNLQK